MGDDGSGNAAVSITGSFLITLPPDGVQDSGDWDGVSDFSITFTQAADSLAGYPTATFTNTNLPCILETATAYGGPFYNFVYNYRAIFPGDCFPLPGAFAIEADGLDGFSNYCGFDMGNSDGAFYYYGVGGTQYSGNLYDASFNDPATAAPEPASIAVLGVGLAGVLAARRRRRDVGTAGPASDPGCQATEFTRQRRLDDLARRCAGGCALRRRAADNTLSV